MQKKHPREKKSKRHTFRREASDKQHRRRKPEKLFGLTMPLRINVLTGTPITPDGSTSIYDILFTRKHAEEGYQRGKQEADEEAYQRGKQEAEKMDIEEQIRREALAHDTGAVMGYFSGRKGEKLALDAQKQYQLIVTDTKQTIKKKPIEYSRGFDYYTDAAEHVRGYMGPNAPPTEEILKQLGRKEGVTVGDLVFEMFVRREEGPKEVKLNRWKHPPNLKIESGPPPPPLPKWEGKRPPRLSDS
jgi:hypothetical protein